MLNPDTTDCGDILKSNLTVDSTTGHLSVGSTTSNCTWTYPLTTSQYWYTYTPPDKTGAAFKIAEKLIENKLVNVKDDVSKFIKLVNLIVDSI